jgi:APA family basic amino acid/polyamine antiporter
LLNFVLLTVIPAEELAGSTTAAARAARMLLGATGERLLSAVVAIAVLGTANVTLMAGSRIYYAMAIDGLAPRPLASINRFGVPGVALWSAGVWTAVLSLVGTVRVLVNWTTLAILLLSSLTVTALFVLRRRGAVVAAFRCPGYPVTPVVYLVASLGVAAASARDDPWEAAYGLLLVGAGFPLYLLFRRRASPSAPSGT